MLLTAATISGIAALIVAAQVPPPASGPSPGARLREERRSILEGEAAQLEALAKRLDGQKQAAAAKEVRAKIDRPVRGGGPDRFVLLPEIVPGPPKGGGSGLANIAVKPAEAWQAEMKSQRDAAAEALFALAQKAATANPKQFALADLCLRGVIARQPEHAEARRLLGYVPYEGGWATPYAAALRKQNQVLHPVYGWVAQAWIPHLERGELPAPGRRGKEPTWLPAAEADEQHSEWSRRWRIYTEHFSIETNVPFAEAIAFGRQLEAFHELFFSQLADLFAADDRLPLARYFAKKKPSSTLPHQVYYFKSKQEYVDYLTPIEPTIEGSLGIYIPPKAGVKVKRAPAYFFHDPEGQIAATATLFHEVSHQLLFEAGGKHDYERNAGNFWVFEGLGAYFETVTLEPDGTASVGGLVGPRIEAARKMLFDEKQFIPTERLVRLGKTSFMQPKLVYLHYAESMALAVYLMNGHEQEYRESFLEYVKAAYRGLLKSTTGRTLNVRLDVSYEDLDKEFLEFLRRE